MFVRAVTVRALLRAHEREKEQLLAIIREQNDRLMLLVGKPWTLPPRDVEAAVEPEPEPDVVTDEDGRPWERI